MLSWLSQKQILWDLCQLSQEKSVNSTCQRLGRLGNFLGYVLSFEENTPQGMKLWVDNVCMYMCVCVRMCVGALLIVVVLF